LRTAVKAKVGSSARRRQLIERLTAERHLGAPRLLAALA
jgi:hypothetical protein